MPHHDQPPYVKWVVVLVIQGNSITLLSLSKLLNTRALNKQNQSLPFGLDMFNGQT